MFTIDAYTWPWPCAIERQAELKPSDISGLMLDRSYFNDIIGTYMSYTVMLATPIDQRDEYSRIYELLTEPVDGHAIVLDYNQGTVQITGRVSGVIADTYVRLPGDGRYWKGIRFTVTANHPTKYLTLTEALSRGRSPLPEIAQPGEGDTYTWTDGHWALQASYPDADNIAY